MMNGCTPKVSHFHVFGCKFFILKKGKNLDKFEARSINGIVCGYASHFRGFRVLNLETNKIVETCEVTFDKTEPRSSLVFNCAGADELGEEIFQEGEHEHGDDEDGGVAPAAEHVPTTSTTIGNMPSPTPTTTSPNKGEAVAEGGGSFKMRTTQTSSSGLPSFEDHRGHKRSHYIVEGSKQFSLCPCCYCCYP
jgi:hypothetical protein